MLNYDGMGVKIGVSNKTDEVEGMKKKINLYTFERVSRDMGRKFGAIKKGEEENYSFLLFPMEGNLLKVNRIHQINNGRRALEAVRLCLHMVDGYINQTEYDLDEYITANNRIYLNALLMSFDPFTNDELLPLVEQQYQTDSSADLEEYFKLPVMCLLRIEKSIERWTKELGTNGYFDFLESQIGRAVPNDDKMNFTVSGRKDTQ